MEMISSMCSPKYTCEQVSLLQFCEAESSLLSWTIDKAAAEKNTCDESKNVQHDYIHTIPLSSAVFITIYYTFWKVKVIFITFIATLPPLLSA